MEYVHCQARSQNIFASELQLWPLCYISVSKSIALNSPGLFIDGLPFSVQTPAVYDFKQGTHVLRHFRVSDLTLAASELEPPPKDSLTHSSSISRRHHEYNLITNWSRTMPRTENKSNYGYGVAATSRFQNDVIIVATEHTTTEDWICLLINAYVASNNFQYVMLFWFVA
jgi:hypothetical protein